MMLPPFIQSAAEFFGKLLQPRKTFTPADFRRGYRKHKIIGRIADPNSKHIGIFTGGITPMKRRFKGVSRTAKSGRK